MKTKKKHEAAISRPVLCELENIHDRFNLPD